MLGVGLGGDVRVVVVDEVGVVGQPAHPEHNQHHNEHNADLEIEHHQQMATLEFIIKCFIIHKNRARLL